MVLKIQQFIILLLAHFLLFPIYFNGISKTVQQLLIFGGIMVYVFFNFNNIQPLYQSLVNKKKAVLTSVVFIVLILSASLLIPIIYGTNDFTYFSYLLGPLIYTFFYIILTGMIRIYFSGSSTKIKTLEILSIVQRNYVITTLIFLLFPKIKMAWINLIIMTPRQMELIQEPSYITRVSWDGYAGFSSTVFSTIVVVITVYLIIEYYKKFQQFNLNYIFTLFLSLIGNAFYGRSGLVISMLIIGIGVIYLVVFYKQYKLLYSIIGSVLGLFIFITILSSFNDTAAKWYNWLLEPAINLFETGELQTQSTNILRDMWFIPDIRTILVGDGYYTSPLNSGYYMGTDVGFLRPLLFYGFIFTALYYLIPIIIGLNIDSDNNRTSQLLIFMFFISIFIFEVKGEVILNFLPILSMIFVADHVREPSKIEHYQMERNYEIGVRKNEYYLERN